jgi:DNA topoisomerase I
MAKSLIIVESPAKTKTLKNFLGKDFLVEASMGHVRDLPEREIGVDVENDFTPKYVNIPTRRDVIKKLTEAVKKVDTVYLASDPDREGEAIAWHLASALKLKNPKRVTFNDLSRQTVLNGIEHPRQIDDKLVDAQEARRVLDRLVGYRLSPLLWKKVRKNLSAGRVQSVVVRLIVDREREIQAFVPEEYWSLTATLTPQPPAKRFPFEAKFVGRNDLPANWWEASRTTQAKTDKIDLRKKEDTQGVVDALRDAAYRVFSVKSQERRRNPSAPFITSTLQQEAARKLGFGNRRTMSVAQSLYEGVELGAQGSVGLITYMRTDSTRVASEAQTEAREYIAKQFGEDFLPPSPPQYKTKSAAQDAHEAIRPTSVFRTPESIAEFLKPEEYRLYRLIWQRFVASQMKAALFDVTTADVDANRYTFRATGSVLKFQGFMAVYTEGKDTAEKTDEEQEPLPPLAVGQPLDLISLDPRQHFTEPPPRYTEATLVKALEEKNVGRPSTWASFIATIQEREYVVLEDKRFKPTDLGFTVNDLLVKHFPELLDVGFTAGMETKLDDVEEGHYDKVKLLREFYGPFDQSIAVAHETMERVKPAQVETEHICPNCGKPMMLRQSKRGPFLGCSGYPKCKTVLNIDEEGNPVAAPERPQPVVTDQACPKCGKPLVEREGRLGKFLGCSGYPKCKTIVNLPGQEGAAQNGAAGNVPIGVKCPKDGGEIVAKKTRYGALYICSNEPTCDFKSWSRPLDQPCPQCGWPLGEVSYRGRVTGQIKCTNPDCGYSEKAGAKEKAEATA